MAKEIKTTTLTFEEFSNAEKLPAKYYFKNALGDYVFIHVKTRQLAKQYIDKEYRDMYSVRCSVLEKTEGSIVGDGTVSAR